MLMLKSLLPPRTVSTHQQIQIEHSFDDLCVVILLRRDCSDRTPPDASMKRVGASSALSSHSDTDKKESDGRDPPHGVGPHVHSGVVGAHEGKLVNKRRQSDCWIDRNMRLVYDGTEQQAWWKKPLHYAIFCGMGFFPRFHSRVAFIGHSNFRR